MYRFGLLLAVLICGFTTALAQSSEEVIPREEYRVTSYAYIQVEGRFLSNRLKVSVDLGDSNEQIREGQQLSFTLNNKKSYAAVLNYMAELGYELVNTLDLTRSHNGSGGTTGIVYVMKKVDYL